MSASDPEAWVRYAEADALAARLLLDNDAPFHLAAGHAQQCAEKAIKALLVVRGQVPRKTHDLGRLLRDLGSEIAGFPPDADIDRLSDYASASRYPDDLAIVSEAEALEAVETAEAVLGAAREALASGR